MKNFFLAILFTTGISHAQQTELSVAYGYGTWNKVYSNFNILPKYGGLNPVYNDVSLGVKCFPRAWGHFSISSGIDLGFRKSHYTSITRYMRVPACVDFTFGKRVKMTISTGIFGSVLYQYILVNQNDDIKKTVNRLQVGNRTSIGASVILGKHWAVGLFYQRNTDFVRYYSELLVSSGGGNYTQKVLGYDNFLKLGIMYSLKPWSEYNRKARRNEDQW